MFTRMLGDKALAAGFALTCAVSVLLGDQRLMGGIVLDDAFHHGEFIAVAQSVATPLGPGAAPLTIHGVLDYLPTLIAMRHWGTAAHFVPALALYKLLDLAAAALLVLLCLLSIRRTRNHRAVMVVCALAAPGLTGYRDLLLLGALCIFVLVVTRPFNALMKFLLLTCLGALTAFGMVWSFDRGLAGALALGLSTLLLSFFRREYLIVAGAFVATFFLVLPYTLPLSLRTYLENVSVLVEGAGDWRYAWTYWTVTFTVVALLVGLAALVELGKRALQDRNSTEWLALFFAWAVVVLCMTRISINRADITHFVWGLWAPVVVVISAGTGSGIGTRIGSLILAACLIVVGVSWSSIHVILVAVVFLSSCFFIEALPGAVRGERDGRLVLMAVIVGCAALMGFERARAVGEGQLAWITFLRSPPSNSMASPPGVRWAAERLRSAKVSCVFDLSNSGLINGLLQRPSCSRFTYPVYAARGRESELLEDVVATAPAAIVYTSSNWSYSIDGRPMSSRFPSLDAYLRLHYSREECGDGYCVRYREP